MAPGYDHISSAIGAAGRYIDVVIPDAVEHPGLPMKDDVKIRIAMENRKSCSRRR
ncbi:hypothetical protein KRX51_09325 [Corynebacterium sp. TAE3-ERU12]|nr:hypothetical protein [Corynebacterium sp. TAE3-ERU12]